MQSGGYCREIEGLAVLRPKQKAAAEASQAAVSATSPSTSPEAAGPSASSISMGAIGPLPGQGHREEVVGYEW